MKRAITLLAAALLAAPALGDTYAEPDGLRGNLVPGPDPFLGASPGKAAAPGQKPPRAIPTDGNLTLLRGYIVRTAPVEDILTIAPVNPFQEPDADTPSVVAVSRRERLPEWNRVWSLVVEADAWSSLQAAWEASPAEARRVFRDAAGVDWPLEGSAGPRADVARLAHARWVRDSWRSAMQAQLGSLRQRPGVRGPIALEADVEGLLNVLAAGDTVSHPAPRLSPRVTTDSAVNRYGAGFVVRLTADLGRRIPLPTLDLSSLSAADAGWAATWVNECVRNGVAGLTIVQPRNAGAAKAVASAVKPLEGTNVYLPPPSDAAIVVSLDTALLEPGAWTAVFRAYTAFRAAGVWPEFVSDDQIAQGMGSLSRFRLLAVPAARVCEPKVVSALTDWTRAGGTLMLTDPNAFSLSPAGNDFTAPMRRLRGWSSVSGALTPTVTPAPGTAVLHRFADGRPAVTERTLGRGKVVAAPVSLTEPPGRWSRVWREVASSAAVSPVPWREDVSAANVRGITGSAD